MEMESVVTILSKGLARVGDLRRGYCRMRRRMEKMSVWDTGCGYSLENRVPPGAAGWFATTAQYNGISPTGPFRGDICGTERLSYALGTS